jgi:N-acetylglutamate synthase-like GNAT family acetyltransferase
MEVCVKAYQGVGNEKIIDLILGIQTKEFGISITAADQPDLLNIESAYQSGAGNFWLATCGDRVVGTVGLIDIGAGRGVLRKMFVAPDFRGKEKGIAQRLLSEVLTWAGGHGLHEVTLGTTSKYHAAHRFYEKNGFKEIDQSDLPQNFPLMGVDSKFYRLLVAVPS